MNKNCANVPVHTTNTMVFQWKYFKSTWGKFSKWWYQDRFDKITVQSDTCPYLSHENINYTLTYVRVDEFDDQSYKNKISPTVRRTDSCSM